MSGRRPHSPVLDLGRETDIIDVGGEKVYPAEVEGLVRTVAGVAEVAVCGEPNPILGNMVVARIRLRAPETTASFRRRMFAHLQGVPRHKLPQKVLLVDSPLYGERFKTIRSGGDRPATD